MKNQSWYWSCGKHVSNSLSKLRKMILKKGIIGMSYKLEKHTEESNHRLKGKTVIKILTIVKEVRYCKYCGVEKTRKSLISNVKGSSEVYISSPCSSGDCKEYQKELSQKKVSYGKCACGRTSILGQKCPMCDGPEYPKEQTLTFEEWVTEREEVKQCTS